MVGVGQVSLYDDGPAAANTKRAQWALTALEAFGRLTGQAEGLDTLEVGEDYITEVAGDLVCDLFHLAHINGLAPEAITDAAHLHFAAEIQEEREGE